MLTPVRDEGIPMPKLPPLTLVLTSTYALGVNVVWLSYNIFILPLQVQQVTTAATEGIVLGVLAGTAIGLAVVVNILAGIISDHSQSRFGRRRPLLLWGTLCTIPFILFPLFLPLSLPTVVLAYTGVQIFTNISAGAWQPTLADFVPVEQRGRSAGIKGVFTLIGAAIGVGGVTGLFALNLQGVAFVVIAACFLSMTLINVVAMRRYDKPQRAVQRLKMTAVLLDMFHIQKAPGWHAFWWFVLGSFLIYLGVSGFQFFGIYYLESILHITNPETLARAVQVSGLLNLLVGVIFSLLAGILSDRLGRRNIIILSVVIAGIVGIFFPFAHTFAVFLAFSSFYGAANGVILSVDTALTSDMVPLQEAGKYMAYANLAVGVANGIAPPLFGLLLNFQGAPTLTSFVLFFVASALFFAISALVMAYKVPNR